MLDAETNINETCFQLHRSIQYMQIIFSKYTYFLEVSDNLKKLADKPCSLKISKKIRYVANAYSLCTFTYDLQRTWKPVRSQN